METQGDLLEIPHFSMLKEVDNGVAVVSSAMAKGANKKLAASSVAAYVGSFIIDSCDVGVMASLSLGP